MNYELFTLMVSYTFTLTSVDLCEYGLFETQMFPFLILLKTNSSIQGLHKELAKGCFR